MRQRTFGHRLTLILISGAVWTANAAHAAGFIQDGEDGVGGADSVTFFGGTVGYRNSQYTTSQAATYQLWGYAIQVGSDHKFGSQSDPSRLGYRYTLQYASFQGSNSANSSAIQETLGVKEFGAGVALLVGPVAIGGGVLKPTSQASLTGTNVSSSQSFTGYLPYAQVSWNQTTMAGNIGLSVFAQYDHGTISNETTVDEFSAGVSINFLFSGSRGATVLDHFK